jgi:hypothetical protein
MLSCPSTISLPSRTLNHLADRIRSHRQKRKSRWCRLSPDRSTRGPTESTVLKTTAHHPFWDATSSTWVDDAKLVPGESTLIGPDGQAQYVTAVRNHIGAEVMRDLTVDNIHTARCLRRGGICCGSATRWTRRSVESVAKAGSPDGAVETCRLRGVLGTVEQ